MSRAFPSERESTLARESERVLSSSLGAELGVRGAQSYQFTLLIGGLSADDKGREKIELPVSVLHLLTQLLGGIAAGDEVAVVPVSRELSTFEAADLSNVSRPYLIKLLDAGAIRFGASARIGAARNLLAYKRADDAKRAAVLDDLVAEAQELNMSY